MTTLYYVVYEPENVERSSSRDRYRQRRDDFERHERVAKHGDGEDMKFPQASSERRIYESRDALSSFRKKHDDEESSYTERGHYSRKDDRHRDSNRRHEHTESKRKRSRSRSRDRERERAI
ncbi:hypothetical protein H0H92_009048, partial [Tricholoma furcatifolium]